MMKIRFFKQIKDSETANRVLYHNEKIYELFSSKRIDATLSPYEAFSQYGVSLQNGDLVTVEYEGNHGCIEAYCYIDDYLIVIPDITRHAFSNGKHPLEREEGFEGTKIEAPEFSKKEDRRAFLRYLKNFVKPYTVIGDLKLKIADVQLHKEQQKEWQLTHPEAKKNRDKAEESL